MTDRTLLREKIAESGIVMRHLAEKCGITPQSFSGKINGHNNFSMSEAATLKDILGLTDEEFMAIFFAKDEA